MLLSATLTIDESMIAMMRPSITVRVIRNTGGSGRTSIRGAARGTSGEARVGARDAMTISPEVVAVEGILR